MALYFSTQGLDVSGFGEGIAKGIEKAAEQSRYERKLLTDEFKEFSRTFVPTKIINAEDTKAFTDASFEWKELKKQVLKAEKGGLFKKADTEKVNALESQAQAAYDRAVNVYSDRVEMNGVLKKTQDIIESNSKKGIINPKRLIDQANYIRTTGVANIDKSTIVNPADIPVKSDIRDLNLYKVGLYNSNKNTMPVEEKVGEPIIVGAGILGKNKEGIKVSKIQTYKQPDPVSAKNFTISTASGRTLENDATESWNTFQARLQSPDPIVRASAEDEVKKISIKANTPVSQIDKFDYFTYLNNGYERVYDKAPKYDKDELMMAFKSVSALNAQDKANALKENNELSKMMRFMTFIKSPGTQAVLMNYTKGEGGKEGSFELNKNIPESMMKALQSLGINNSEDLNTMYSGVQATMGKDWNQFLRNIAVGNVQNVNPNVEIPTDGIPNKE